MILSQHKRNIRVKIKSSLIDSSPLKRNIRVKPKSPLIDCSPIKRNIRVKPKSPNYKGSSSSQFWTQHNQTKIVNNKYISMLYQQRVHLASGAFAPGWPRRKDGKNTHAQSSLLLQVGKRDCGAPRKRSEDQLKSELVS